MQNKINKKNSGYTILETMIAISLFIVIVMAGMGALLNANLLSNKAQNMRSIIDNLSFVMEDMGRNLRTGSNYDCLPSGGSVPSVAIPTSGQSCGGVAFKPGSGGNIWVYYIGVNPNNSSIYSIFKVVDGTTVQLTPDEVSINSISGFSVLGAEPPPGDSEQPFVTIKLNGTIILNSTVSTLFSLQTSVSQRLVDL